mmetsp:Transcript_3013/g.7290  ORF Transcript_3013/g.7290 Transcript_3013/m.7290 type:complete len:291 (-) Transcript_3013:2-874(-)
MDSHVSLLSIRFLLVVPLHEFVDEVRPSPVLVVGGQVASKLLGELEELDPRILGDGLLVTLGDKVAPLVAQGPLVNAEEKLPHPDGRVEEERLLTLFPREAEGKLVNVLELCRVVELVAKRGQLFLQGFHRVAIQALKPSKELLLGVFAHHGGPHVARDHERDGVRRIHTEILTELGDSRSHHQVLILVLVLLVDLLQRCRLDGAVLCAFREHVLDRALQVPLVAAQNARRQALIAVCDRHEVPHFLLLTLVESIHGLPIGEASATFPSLEHSPAPPRAMPLPTSPHCSL